MKEPFIIAGPCSAESRDQIMVTAAAVQAAGAAIFRAGLWKPRTRPGTFEGVGEQGIAWLREVRDSLGMRVCTEVACAAHVESCLDAGLDCLWIGARTAANPFQVQEIADALKGSCIEVLIKNPVNPDIELWAGDVERLRDAGIKDIVLVHRGFSPVTPLKYRNGPQWGIAVQMRSRFPELPMLCDPSHIGGSREYVREISQRALDLGMDGLMIEVHCNPDGALSDSRQQLSTEEFAGLRGSLVARSSDSDNREYRDSIEMLRSRIDTIDEQLVGLLAERMNLSREIGKAKKDNNISIVQTSRWEEVLSNVREYAGRNSLDADFVEDIFNCIHAESAGEQNKILGNDCKE